MACLGTWALIAPAAAADLAAQRQADLAYARSEYVVKTLALSPEHRRQTLA